jgi:hypothetical protein
LILQWGLKFCTRHFLSKFEALPDELESYFLFLKGQIILI